MQLVFTGKRVAIYFLVLVGVLALVSMLKETMLDGGFPSGEFRIRVVDGQGQPIPGTTLRVYAAGTRNLASKYPIYENCVGGIAAGEDGVVVCPQPREGVQYSYTGHKLFWRFPIGAEAAPQFDYEFSRKGYRTRVLTNRDFFYEGFDAADDPAQTVNFTWVDPKERAESAKKSVPLPVRQKELTLNSK